MNIDPNGDSLIGFLLCSVIVMIVFAIISTSPELQESVTIKETDGSIEKGSFGYGKAVWAKNIYVGVNETGTIYDLKGNPIEEITSTNYIDAQFIYIGHELNGDGIQSYNCGFTLLGFYIEGEYSDGRFKINGGIAATFRYGLGLKSGSYTIDFNPIGYFWDKISPED